MGLPAPYGVASVRRPLALLKDVAQAVITGQFTGVGPGKWFPFMGQANLAIYASVNTPLTTTNGSLAASVVSGTGIAAGGAINSANVPPGTTWATFSGTAGTLALPSIDLQADYAMGVQQLRGLRITPPYLVGATVIDDGLPAGTTITGIITPAVTATNNSPATLGVVSISTVPTTTNSNIRGQPGWVTVQLNAASITSGTDAAALFTGASTTYSGTVQLERSFDGGATPIVCNIGGSGTLAQYSAGTPVSTRVDEAESDVLYRLNCIAYTSGTINYRMSETATAASSLDRGATV